MGAVGLVNWLARLQDAAAAGDGDEARTAAAEALQALNRLESRMGA